MNNEAPSPTVSKETNLTIRNSILNSCVERMDSLGLKGKRREEEALSYICGAAQALEFTNHEAAKGLIILLQMVLCVRGAYSESKHIVAEARKAQA